jgi:hypothetical protein
MVVPDSTNSIDICAVVAAYIRVLGRKDLQVPTRRVVWFFEDGVWQEGYRGPLVAGSHYDDVCFDEFLTAGPVFGDAAGALGEGYCGAEGV